MHAQVPAGTRGKDIECVVSATEVRVGLRGQRPLLAGALHATVRCADSTWTLEDGRVELLLCKARAQHAWPAVLAGAAPLDPLTHDSMQKRMMLERFQQEVRSPPHPLPLRMC